jgi:hypothetical protein
MAGKVDGGALVTAILIAVAIGAGAGFGVGLLARELGWSTGLVGPLTGAIVGGLVPLLYRVRARQADPPGA